MTLGEGVTQYPLPHFLGKRSKHSSLIAVATTTFGCRRGVIPKSVGYIQHLHVVVEAARSSRQLVGERPRGYTRRYVLGSCPPFSAHADST